MFVIVGLFIILGIVLFAPFSVKRVEEELEIFLFFIGCISVTITSQWSLPLIKDALLEPVKITLAVLVAGFIFRSLQKPIAHRVNRTADAMGVKFFAFTLIVVLGLLSA